MLTPVIKGSVDLFMYNGMIACGNPNYEEGYLTN
jgi:hypothetical protein